MYQKIKEILFFSGGRKVAQNKPNAAARPQNALPGRPFKVSDEITIIPQGKNTQANKPKKVSKFRMRFLDRN